MEELPQSWRDFMGAALDVEAFAETQRRVEAERGRGVKVFPPQGCLFTSFYLTSPENVRVVILGQDPYHDDGQAEGLAFSVAPGVKFPPSLRNIFKEYASDLNRGVPKSGSLRNWAKNGVLLLNSVLSVEAHRAGSHKKMGWEKFTDSVIVALNQKESPIVFLLWGNFAASKRALIDESKHKVFESVHPSPLSAHRGFFGSCPFSRSEQSLGNWHWPEL